MGLWGKISALLDIANSFSELFFMSQRGASLLYEWQHARGLSCPPGPASVRQQYSLIRWIKSQPGFVNSNIDASFFSASNQVGIGMCLRDENGQFLGAKTVIEGY